MENDAVLDRPAPSKSVDKFIKNIRSRFDFSDEEKNLLVSRMDGEISFSAGETIVEQGQTITYSSLLFEGMSCREKSTESGSRQILGLQIPGDFVDLHSYPLEYLDHSLVALTDCKLVTLPHERIDDLIETHPRFARLLWFSTIGDASVHREWIQNLGARKGSARMAHLFCEMYARMKVVGLTDDGSFALPLTQGELGDALGFTQIHVNRVLKDLREAGLAEFRQKTVHIADHDRLAKHAGFDPNYLYLSRRKR